MLCHIKIAALALLTTLSIQNSFAANKISQIYLGEHWVVANPAPAADIFSATKFFQTNAFTFVNTMARHFLANNAKLLGLSTHAQLLPTETVLGEEWKTIRLKKIFHGLEVLGGEALIHLQQDDVDFMSADNTYLESLNTHVTLDTKTAADIALSSYVGLASTVDAPKLQVILLPIDNETKAPHLIYQVTVRDLDGFSSNNHFIDAHTGQEVLVTPNVQPLKDRTVLAGQGNSEDFDLDVSTYKLVLTDRGCTRNPVNGRTRPCTTVSTKVWNASLQAMNNSGLTYDFYQTKFKRDSIDNRGMQIRSVVNFADRWANAAWVNDKKLMIYGAGEDSTQNDFSYALDVAAHELTHGLTASTSGLLYASQSGALNESYSDVFGKLVAFTNRRSSDWTLGRELFKSGTRYIRDLARPTVGHMRDIQYPNSRCNQFNDYCGVHDNSGIPTRAAVLLANSIGLEKLGKIYYLTLTQLLRPSSTFRDAKAQTLQACKRLFGDNATECAAVTRSFNTVGI